MEIETKPGILRITLIALGWLFTGLGFIGVFIPLLPTTPFLLVAAAAFARSSPRFHHWLTRDSFMSEYLENYREHRAMTRRHKILVLLLLWITILSSFFFFTDSTAIRIFLIIIAIVVSIHIFLLRNISI